MRLVAAPMLLAAVLMAQEPPATAITRVSIVDARADTAVRDQTVVLRGSRIFSVGPASRAAVPPGARMIDGRGLYLMPGLWDMHVHTDVPAGRAMLAVYLANGVTGVRDMAGRWDTLATWRREIAAGRLAGPRFVISGPYLEGGETPIPHLLSRSVEEAVRAVDSLAGLGVDVLKVHGRLRPEVFFAIARRARERGIPFAGHVSQAVGAQAASDSGARSIEHLLGVPMPCTAAESIALRPRFPVQAAIGRCVSRDLAPLYASLARNQTWVTPTVVAMYEVAHWPRRDLPGDAYAPWIPDTLQRFVAAIFPMPDSIPPDANVAGHAMLRHRQRQLLAMRRAGVAILAGTDAPLRNAPPGFGLHEELALLADAGLSARDVIAAATLEPARYLAATDSLGTVEAGKLADLVLLEADPLRDIRNTRRIRRVFANGREVDRAAIRAPARTRSTRSP